MEALGSLKPVFDPENGTVTAGNSSQLSDGASVNLIMSEEKALELGLKPVAYFRGFTTMGCEPDEMGIGPVFAIPKLLKRNGLKMEDIGLWELNKLGRTKAVGELDPSKLNKWGGSLSIGHPFGATGSRLLTTASNRLINNLALSQCVLAAVWELLGYSKDTLVSFCPQNLN